jgi:hypothetical protein
MRSSTRSSGGVVAYSRQGAQLRGFRWQPAAEVAHHQLRCPMQHARATVVAQAAPQSQHRLDIGCGEIGERGKALQELTIALGYGGHAGLLQHDLGDPRRIRIVDAAPRQGARVIAVPVDQTRAKLRYRKSAFAIWGGR